jgi:hypothetical protein
MAILCAINVWRVGEAIGLARAVPDLATATPPVLAAGYGLVFAAAFGGCAWLAWRRHRWAGRAAVLGVVMAFAVGAALRLGLAASPEPSLTFGFYAILNALALFVTVAVARAPRNALGGGAGHNI